MAEKITLTCDRVTRNEPCGQPAHTYVITGPQGEWSMDLCDKHAGPIYDPFIRDGRVPVRDTARRTLSDTARPFYEDR